jgi:hypothetical protein
MTAEEYRLHALILEMAERMLKMSESLSLAAERRECRRNGDAMQIGEKMTAGELNTLLNSHPEGTVGHETDRIAIGQLDAIGALLGYGFLNQLAGWLYETQCHADPENAAKMKRERFRAMGWPLPGDFEWVASK